MINELKSDHYLESKSFLFHIEPYRLDCGTVISPHRHEFVELVIITQGAGLHEYEGNIFPINAGDVFIIEPGTDHAYRINHGEGMEVINLLFVPSLLEKELDLLSGVTSFIDFYYMEPFLRSDVSFRVHQASSVPSIDAGTNQPNGRNEPEQVYRLVPPHHRHVVLGIPECRARAAGQAIIGRDKP